jgi:hypothetical protein
MCGVVDSIERISYEGHRSDVCTLPLNALPRFSGNGPCLWGTVKRLGWRHYGAASFFSMETKSRIAPIHIRAHALAEGVPNRDLLVSPWHHVLVAGKLARAGDLVNDITILQASQLTEVT